MQGTKIFSSLSNLWKKEEGQSMVFGAISMFVLACFIALVYNIGDVSSRKIQVQNAADAAAFSGVLIESNSLNTIAWINDGMAFIYYHIMRYAVDYITFGVLREFKRTGPPAPDFIVGVSNINQKANDARQLAAEWIPRGQRWLKNLSQMELGIAKATPWLIRKEVIDIARANGADAVALIPDPANPVTVTMDPDGNSYMKRGKKNSYEHWRFAEEKQKDYIDKYGEFPTWWSKFMGMSQMPYYQIRTCWNSKDRDPNTNMGHQPMWPANKGQPTWSHFTGNNNTLGIPAGHWHMEHTHYKFIVTPYGAGYVPFIVHEDGHMDSGSHPQFDEPAPPEPDHHYMEICPTCQNLDYDSVLPYSRQGETGRTSIAKFQFDLSNDNLQKIDLNSFEIPLSLKGEFQKNGLTVMVWRSPSKDTLIKAVFKNPEAGFFALARGQIGKKEGDKIKSDNLVGFLNSTQNLFEDVEFGARMVPLANTPDADTILSQFMSANWYSSADQTDSRPASYLSRMGPKRNSSLSQLRNVIYH